jgi:hypothetical protein
VQESTVGISFRALLKVRWDAMRVCWACFFLCAGQMSGCANPQPALTRVDPAEAECESDVWLTMVGDRFVPSATVDPVSGLRSSSMDGFHLRLGTGNVWAELENLTWVDIGHIKAKLSSEVALGLPYRTPLDVDLIDPRGQHATLGASFTELGPDLTPPTIVFTSPSPNTPVIAGMDLKGSIVATDPHGVNNLSWTYLEDDAQPIHKVCDSADLPCPFEVKVSKTLKPGDTIRIRADADDGLANPNPGVELAFTLLPIPLVADIVPKRGGTAGGTDVVVTGVGLLPGTRASVDGVELFPNGGIVSADGFSLSGHMPAHPPGNASLSLKTYDVPSADNVAFEYVAAPRILSIEPDGGSVQGGTTVSVLGRGFSSSTMLFFGSTFQSALPLREPHLTNDTIEGLTPSGQAGTTTVWAFDDALGLSALPGAFTWRTP